ncbi:MAG TPA: helix-turn-helix transcriptional regulator [Vicinamibacterales bacterium]|jgi:transcriptional regulator with XRE-family HTH domain
MTERETFGLELRRTRERRGLTLNEIAEKTKVKTSLFAGLEQNDLSRWPAGIFRRGFVRSYAEAIGLDPEEVVSRFVRLFPETTGEPVNSAVQSADPRTQVEVPALRLVLDQPQPVEHGRSLARAERRLVAGAMDIGLALVPAVLIALWLGREWFWATAACVGLAGHVTALCATGSTPGTWLLLREPAPIDALPAPVAPVARRVDTMPPAQPAPRRHSLRQVPARTQVRSHRLPH